MAAGLPRPAMMASNSRATRAPDKDVSAISARHSRVQSSTTHRMRKRRPLVIWSETKSSDQRILAAIGKTIGARVPSARLQAAALANHQPLFPVEPVNALAVHQIALPAQEHMQAPVTEPPPLMRQGPEPFAQRSIVRASGLIAHAGPVTANDT